MPSLRTTMARCEPSVIRRRHTDASISVRTALYRLFMMVGFSLCNAILSSPKYKNRWHKVRRILRSETPIFSTDRCTGSVSSAAMHAAYPNLTFDFTAKVEHILKHRKHFPRIRTTRMQICYFCCGITERDRC